MLNNVRDYFSINGQIFYIFNKNFIKNFFMGQELML